MNYTYLQEKNLKSAFKMMVKSPFVLYSTLGCDLLITGGNYEATIKFQGVNKALVHMFNHSDNTCAEFKTQNKKTIATLVQAFNAAIEYDGETPLPFNDVMTPESALCLKWAKEMVKDEHFVGEKQLSLLTGDGELAF